VEPIQLSKVEKKTLMGRLEYLQKRKSSLEVQLLILSSPFLCMVVVLLGGKKNVLGREVLKSLGEMENHLLYSNLGNNKIFGPSFLSVSTSFSPFFLKWWASFPLRLSCQ
jgi:hypothetical protein